jgi:hypothetical protein
MFPGKRVFWGTNLAEKAKEEGFSPIGATAVPFLHRRFGFGRGFDAWDVSGARHITPIHRNLDWIRDHLGKKNFIFLNVGETHYPYAYEGRPRKGWEKILPDLLWKWSERQIKMDESVLRAMHHAQVESLEYVDGMLSQLKDLDAVWLVTSDHGELFGEHHLFGHGHGCYPEEVTVPIICSDWNWMYERMLG